MIRSIKLISFILIIACLGVLFYFNVRETHDIVVQNKIIDSVFNVSVDDEVTTDYLGYIYIPRFNIKRLIKEGTSSSVLDGNYVGMHKLSGSLEDSDLVILAGHNIPNVFGKLHSINIGDVVYIKAKDLDRKFVVYDSFIVSEYDFSYLKENRQHELLLITCTNTKGERLLVMLKEEL